MTAFGSTISPTSMKQWFYSGITNAAAKRQDEIWGYLKGLTWVRKNAAMVSNNWIDPVYVSLENHYYWIATSVRDHRSSEGGDKTWILYPEREEMGIEVEHWVLREWLFEDRVEAGDKWMAGWSLGIMPSSHYIAINKQYL